MSPPAFACGMTNPWAPDPLKLSGPMFTYTPMKCDHCFCLVQEKHAGDGKHMRCCKCSTIMADKFVEAWFKAVPSVRAPTEAKP